MQGLDPAGLPDIWYWWSTTHNCNSSTHTGHVLPIHSLNATEFKTMTISLDCYQELPVTLNSRALPFAIMPLTWLSHAPSFNIQANGHSNIEQYTDSSWNDPDLRQTANVHICHCEHIWSGLVICRTFDIFYIVSWKCEYRGHKKWCHQLVSGVKYPGALHPFVGFSFSWWPLTGHGKSNMSSPTH